METNFTIACVIELLVKIIEVYVLIVFVKSQKNNYKGLGYGHIYVELSVKE